jgi:hypothetical protein
MKNYIQIAKVIILSIVITVFLVELIHDPGAYIGRWLCSYQRLINQFTIARTEYYTSRFECMRAINVLRSAKEY